MEARKNLTNDARLVRPAPDVQAAPGRHLVVFEETKQGRRFLEVFPPGKLFRLGWFKKPEDFSAFLVSAARDHRHRFSRVCQTIDHRYDFTLHFDVAYRVRDPRTLVESRDRDPLRVLEDRTASRVTGLVCRLEWKVIWTGGAEFDRVIREPVSDGGGMCRTLLEQLDEEMRGQGLEVLALHVNRVLPETALAPDGHSLAVDRELQEKEDRLRLDEQEQEHEKRLKTQGIRGDLTVGEEQHRLDLQKQRHQTELQARGSIQSAMQVLGEMLTRAGTQVQSFPEMRRAVRELHGIRDQLASLAGPLILPDGGNTLPGLGMELAQLPAAVQTDSVVDGEVVESSLADVGVWAVLSDLRDQLSPLPLEGQQALVPPALRLIAATLADPEDNESQEPLREAVLNSLNEQLDDLDDSQNRWLRRLANGKWLAVTLERC